MISVDNKRSSLVTEHLAKVTTSPPIDDHFINRYPQAYAAELEHFLDVMQGQYIYIIFFSRLMQISSEPNSFRLDLLTENQCAYDSWSQVRFEICYFKKIKHVIVYRREFL